MAKDVIDLKKAKSIILILLVLGILFGCTKKPPQEVSRFKADYESLNGQLDPSGTAYRSIEIPENNPFVYSTLEEINTRIANGETFYVYFGFTGCPWCRSVLPTAIKEAERCGIRTIYYVDVRPDNDAEKDIRNVYAVQNNRIIRSHEGTAAYQTFIRTAAEILADYSREDVPSLDGSEFAGEKRVGAPNFIAVENGECVRMITGISELQTDGHGELNQDIIADMEAQFEEFFKTKGRFPVEEKLDEHGYYYSKDEVAEFLFTYKRLPDNYISKKEARKLGWSSGSVDKYKKGGAIGGDVFGNNEGLLPKAKGRTYYECDIDTKGKKSRGSKRIVYSNDGLIYYTDDHYESYTLLYDKGGKK